jgi:hypothetical protein
VDSTAVRPAILQMMGVQRVGVRPPYF